MKATYRNTKLPAIEYLAAIDYSFQNSAKLQTIFFHICLKFVATKGQKITVEIVA